MHACACVRLRCMLRCVHACSSRTRPNAAPAAACPQACHVMDRMVNQNMFEEIAMDFKYWEDASDAFR